MKTEPDALMFREVSDTEWLTMRCAASRIAYHLARGWSVLIRFSDVRDQDITDVYRADMEGRHRT